MNSEITLRQNELDAKMAKGYSYGQESFCAHCWACVHGEDCFASPSNRVGQCLCAKAENREQEQGKRPLPRKKGVLCYGETRKTL